MDEIDLCRAVGGPGTLRRLSVALYDRVARDSLLRPLFPGKTLHCAIEEFAAFLAQFFDGPPENAQRRWWLSLRESHLRFKIGPEERTAWMSNMSQALDDVQMDEPARAALREFFERSSVYLVHIQTASADPATPTGSHQCVIHQEIARRWDAQRKLDEAVAAVRSGDAERAIALSEGPALQTRFNRNRSIFAGLLGVMTGSPDDGMLRYVRAKIAADPALAREYYRGRTLLHEAAAQGQSTLIELLLRIGADPNAMDSGDHTPLYGLANECTKSGAGRMVHVLVDRGANVNADGGVKRCTALHMSARRGNVEVTETLLGCGANIEARDSLGDTPLRRAVNCNKPQVAALLLKGGADAHSIGSKGLTPVLAARSSVMKQLLESDSIRRRGLT